MVGLDYRRVLDEFADPVVAADATNRIVYCNAAAAALLGWPVGDLTGRPLTTIVPPRLRAAHVAGFARYFATRSPTWLGRPMRVPALRRDGGEVDVELVLSAVRADGCDLVVAALRDLRARVELERQVTVTRYLRATTAAAARLTSRYDLDHVLHTVVDTLVADFDAALARIWLYEPATDTLHLRASAGLTRETATSSRARIDVATYPYKVGAVARERQPFVANDLAGDQQFDQAWVAREGIASVAVFPLHLAGTLHGVLAYFARRPLPEDLVDVLGAFVAMATAAINDVALLHAEQAARAAAEETRRRLAFQAEASEALASSLDYAATLERVAGLAVPTLADWCVVDLIAEDGPPERLVVAHADPAKAAWARELERRYPPAADPANVVSRVFQSGASELATDIPDAFLAANARDPEHLRILRALGIGSHMVVPMIARGRTLGALTFVAAESGRRYGPGDLALAEDLAHRAAVAVDNARLYRDLREAERRKDESLALLDTLFATAPVGLGFWDRDLRYVRINDALAAINGPPAADHLGRTLEEMIPQLAPEVRGLFQRVLDTGAPIVGLEMGGETPRAPGERRHWLTDYFPVRGHDGAILGLGAVVTEITGRKRADQERADLLARERAARAEAEAARGRLAFLAEASALLAASLDYRTTLENVARLAVPHLADWCVIDIVEEDGRITPLATAHGDPARLALVQGLRERFPDLASPTEGVRNVLRTGEPELVPAIPADYRGGSPRAEAFLAAIRELGLVSYMVVPLLARGRAFGAITFAAAESGRHYGPADLALAGDLARRAAVAVDNARLYREAQEAVRARDQFLTIAAHELRTPITTVRGNAELLLRRLEREDQPLDREWLAVRLRRLIAGTDRLHALAARVLDLNRLQAGVLDLQPAPCDLAALVAGVVERTRLARLPGTGSTLTLRRPEGPVMGAWDPLRVEQVVANLLDNAVKYQPAGGEIAVEVAATADEAVVRVRDQGIGIAAGDLPRLFAPFARAGTATSSQIAGVGVGLYIADQIARLHGGSIAVTSAVGAGSEFVVRLPRRGARDGREGE